MVSSVAVAKKGSPARKAKGTRGEPSAAGQSSPAPATRTATAGAARPSFARAHTADLVILAVALLVRGVYLWQLGRSPLFPVVAGDGAAYDAWARRIAAGDWLGHAEGVFYQAPLYPYFLAVIHAIAGSSVWAIRLVQGALSAASCVLLARATRRFISPAAGTAAGLILALYAPAVFFDSIVQKSVLDMFFLTLLLLLLARVGDEVGTAAARVRWALVGAALGLLVLTRENALVLVVGVAVWQLVLLWRRSWPVRLGALGALVVGLAAVLLPVAFRNLAVGGEFHLTTSQLGPNLYIGNNPQSQGFYVPIKGIRGNPEFERKDAVDLAEQAMGRHLTPGEVSSYWVDTTLAYIRSQPLHWVTLMGKKTLLMLNIHEVSDIDDLYGYSDYASILKVLALPFNFGVLLALAAAGVALTWKRRAELWLLYLLAVSFAGTVALFCIYGRYRYPLVPFLVPFAAAAVVEGWPLVRERRFRALALPLAAAVAAAAVASPRLFPLDAQRASTEATIGDDLLHRLKRPDEAAEHYERAVHLSPAFAMGYLGLGDARRAQHRLDDAFAAYEQAARYEPRLEAAEYNWGLALSDAGRPQDAAAHFLRAIELNPERASTHDLLGNCLFALGRPDAAVGEYDKAVRLDPNDAHAQSNWGAALARLGDVNGALGHFAAAVRLEPAYAEAHHNLGKAYMALGRTAEAASELETALRLDPSLDDARRRLEQLRATGR